MKKSLFYILLLCMQLLAANDAELFWNTYTAALRGDKETQFQTGVMFERGIGTDLNQSQAAKWYEKAAKQGDKEARVLLLNLIDGKVKSTAPSSNIKNESS